MTKLIRSITVFMFFLFLSSLNWNCTESPIDIHQNNGTDLKEVGKETGDGTPVPVCTARMMVTQDNGEVETVLIDRSFSIYTWQGPNPGGYSSVGTTSTGPGTSTFNVYVDLSWSNCPQDYWYGYYFINGSAIGSLKANIGTGATSHTYYNFTGLSPNTTFTHQMLITPVYEDK